MTQITQDAVNEKFIATENEIEKGYLLYTEDSNNNFIIEFVSVKPQFEGRGLGKQLVKAAANYAKEKKLNLSAKCSYAASVLKIMKI